MWVETHSTKTSQTLSYVLLSQSYNTQKQRKTLTAPTTCRLLRVGVLGKGQLC
ncbi:hypothetical protein FHS57_000409 [Runella defluvii]|uniref:Uncharacterized protein n=1 Tax=Runella defluvii TaxID=370973 RepID=A0A7W5ZIB5_9BACT|nr:hypothetical protein [Runella defluvii]